MRHERASCIAEGRHKWTRPELIRTQKLNSYAEFKFVNFFLILIANGSCLTKNIIIADKKRMKTFFRRQVHHYSVPRLYRILIYIYEQTEIDRTNAKAAYKKGNKTLFFLAMKFHMDRMYLVPLFDGPLDTCEPNIELYTIVHIIQTPLAANRLR